MSQAKIEGEYYFNKMEMAAAFNFSKGGKFQFFYTYGAVDRTATGSFTVSGDSVKLRSDKQPGKDFTITDQSKKGSGYDIRFDHSNKSLLKNISCIFITGGKQQEVFSDEAGTVHSDVVNCDTIYVLHNLFPDVPTLIKDEKNKNNHFVLSLNISLGQVSFKDIYLKIVNNETLECMNNYFMDAHDIKFIKK
jgi:hypothetical protein